MTIRLCILLVSQILLHCILVELKICYGFIIIRRRAYLHISGNYSHVSIIFSIIVLNNILITGTLKEFHIISTIYKFDILLYKLILCFIFQLIWFQSPRKSCRTIRKRDSHDSIRTSKIRATFFFTRC